VTEEDVKRGRRSGVGVRQAYRSDAWCALQDSRWTFPERNCCWGHLPLTLQHLAAGVAD
jgi:hypothetical protein